MVNGARKEAMQAKKESKIIKREKMNIKSMTKMSDWQFVRCSYCGGKAYKGGSCTVCGAENDD